MRHLPDPSREARRALARAPRLDPLFTVYLDRRLWLAGRGWRLELTDELLDELAALPAKIHELERAP